MNKIWIVLLLTMAGVTPLLANEGAEADILLEIKKNPLYFEENAYEVFRMRKVENLPSEVYQTKEFFDATVKVMRRTDYLVDVAVLALRHSVTDRADVIDGLANLLLTYHGGFAAETLVKLAEIHPVPVLKKLKALKKANPFEFHDNAESHLKDAYTWVMAGLCKKALSEERVD